MELHYIHDQKKMFRVKKRDNPAIYLPRKVFLGRINISRLNGLKSGDSLSKLILWSVLDYCVQLELGAERRLRYSLACG